MRRERTSKQGVQVTPVGIALVVPNSPDQVGGKLKHKVDATVMMSGKALYAEASASDMYAAIDLLADKLETQVRKHKGKVTAHHADTVRSARYD